MTELWKMKWVGYAACMAENRKKREIWWENLKETALLEWLCVDRRQILHLNS